MQLPDTGALIGQLTEAGLRPEPAHSIVPGAPLIAVSAVRPEGAGPPR